VFNSVERYRLRTALMLVAMAIGVAAVILLTSLGEGARRYVTGEFAALGSNLLIVIPGRNETTGAGPTVFMGDTPRDLTIEDAMALERSSTVRRVAPISLGSADVSRGRLGREVPILGSNAELIKVRKWELDQGRFLPSGDIGLSRSVCVIGKKVKRELFGADPAIGQWLRIADQRYRVIGIMATEGRSIGIDVQDLVIIPVADAQKLFNKASLFRIVIEAQSRSVLPKTREFVRETLRERHQGEEDITVITQDAVLETFDRILHTLTLTVAGIAAISLAVAGILIMNVMLVAVSQRRAEIGLLKALGATHRQIITLFLSESAALSIFGAVFGWFMGLAGTWIISAIYPAFPVAVPLWVVAAALFIALATGLLFGVLPARKAARLDPIQALSR